MGSGDRIVKKFAWRAGAGLLMAAAALGAAASGGLAPGIAQEPASASAKLGELRAKLEPVVAGLTATTGVAVEDLNSREKFSIRGTEKFVQASSIKIAILISLLKDDQAGRVRLSDVVPIHKADFVGGSGVMQYFTGQGESLTIRDLAVLMIVLSDNAATNYVIDRETIDHVNGTMDEAGFSATRLNRRMMDAAAQRAGRENFSTPDEMCRVLEELYGGKLLDAAHTKTAMEILGYAKDTPLGRGLPTSQIHEDKPGVLPGVRTDSGIVPLAGRPYVLSVMINKAADETAAEKAIEEISRITYEHFKAQQPKIAE
jgi:beta-lactamase class A